ncbi:hypothetical protein D0Z07_3971 [Hyphodiscus hymeniophilus]|uniref:Uncharacterized protein n=1 Tax=Hyphodiscus hymeniophilus TaxID=353542 RepID=A0A9P6VKM5_9HELO|nr:hypothetical protein D0Z07_3971 [Hyphodiscus hymeniophilus]
MMEAPDSPPEAPSSSAGPSSSIQLQSPIDSGDTNHKANSSRSNGDSAAKVNHGAPGSSWSTKKFHEEYDRACGSLLDQNWDSTKFGDPLLK